MELIVNGQKIQAQYKDEDISSFFIPLLQSLAALQKSRGRRIIVYIAAPPGCGKSTFTLFLEKLSQHLPDMPACQAIGMDGFHYSNAYLQNHRDKQGIALINHKGRQDTFDTEKLEKKLQELLAEKICTWPVYSRKIHEPVEDALTVTGKICLLEGNYLLLKEDPWIQLEKYCDVSVLMSISEDILRQRIVQRHMLGGATEEEAIRKYEETDKNNIRTVVSTSRKADIVIMFDENNTVIRCTGI